MFDGLGYKIQQTGVGISNRKGQNQYSGIVYIGVVQPPVPYSWKKGHGTGGGRTRKNDKESICSGSAEWISKFGFLLSGVLIIDTFFIWILKVPKFIQY